jgi:hypothetical protein
MTRGEQRAAYEQALSTARRALDRAAGWAETCGDESAAIDLHEMALHCTVAMRQSLSGKHPIRGQLNLVE